MKASQRFRSDQDLIDGTPRRELMLLAARAIIDSCDDVVLWKIVNVRDSFTNFRALARKYFARHEPGLRFTDQEIAWIYWCIEQQVASKAAAAHQPADAPPPLPTRAPDPADGPVSVETDASPYKVTVH